MNDNFKTFSIYAIYDHHRASSKHFKCYNNTVGLSMWHLAKFEMSLITCSNLAHKFQIYNMRYVRPDNQNWGLIALSYKFW